MTQKESARMGRKKPPRHLRKSQLAKDLQRTQADWGRVDPYEGFVEGVGAIKMPGGYVLVLAKGPGPAILNVYNEEGVRIGTMPGSIVADGDE